MRWAIVGLILLGVLAATCAALLVASFSQRGHAGAAEIKVDVIVAAKALPSFTQITADSVQTEKVLKSAKPATSYSDAVEVVGRTIIVAVKEGQALTSECFGDKESNAKLADKIPKDKVAANISITESSSIDNILYPGCLVDVIFTYRPNNEKEQPTSRTILQGKLVLAIDQYSIINPKPDGDSYMSLRRGDARRITLLLTPIESKQLQLAQSSGSISLALRNPGNTPDGNADSVTLNSLLGRAEPKPPAPPVQSGPTIIQVPVPTSGPAPVVVEPVPPTPLWNMDLIQGGKKETRSFPIPGSDDTTHDNRE